MAREKVPRAVTSATTQRRSLLDEEIESWKGFAWVMRKEDKEVWDKMIQEVKEGFDDTVEKSGKPLTTEPFFMALLLAQQRTIKSLLAELDNLRGCSTATGSRMSG